MPQVLQQAVDMDNFTSFSHNFLRWTQISDEETEAQRGIFQGPAHLLLCSLLGVCSPASPPVPTLSFLFLSSYNTLL